MQKFESLSKEELIKRLNLAMDAALAIDGMWFLNVEELLGFERTNDVNLKGLGTLSEGSAPENDSVL